MTTPFLNRVSERFRQVYRVKLKSYIQVIADMENPEYRQLLTTDDPRKFQLFEGHTKEENETRAQELAMSEAVAEAIRYALEFHNSDSSSH